MAASGPAETRWVSSGCLDDVRRITRAHFDYDEVGTIIMVRDMKHDLNLAGRAW
jgi:hypothetical protein